jgi:hypothetical protein
MLFAADRAGDADRGQKVGARIAATLEVGIKRDATETIAGG